MKTKIKLLSIALFLFLFNSLIFSQTTIYSNNFNSNTNGLSFTSNSSVTFMGITINNIWARGSANGRTALRISNSFDNGYSYVSNANAGDVTATTTDLINTNGYTNVKLSFLTNCKAGSNYTKIQYSIGSVWVDLPGTDYVNQQSWISKEITNSNFDNQNSLKFRFIFHVNSSSANDDPPWAIDDIVVKGTAITTTCTAPTLNPQSDNSSVCSGGSVNLSANPNGGNLCSSGSWDYTWSNNGGNTENITINNIIAPTTYTVTVECSNDATCSSTGTVAVGINTPPSLNPDATNNPICSGDNLTISANPSGGCSNKQYRWSDGTNSWTTENINLTNVTASAVYSLTVNCVSDASCNNTATYNLTVNNCCSAPTLSPTSDNSTICSGGSVNLSANPTTTGNGCTGSWNYSWSDGNGNSWSTENINPTNITAPTTYTVTVSCSNDAASCNNKGEVAVAINTSIIVGLSLTSSDSEICNNESLTITATPTNGGTAPQYKWFINGDEISQTADIITIDTLTVNSNIKCILTSDISCTTDPIAKDSIGITIKENTTTNVSISDDLNDGVCSNADSIEITLTVTTSNGASFNTYQWYKNETAIDGETSYKLNLSEYEKNDTIRCKVEFTDGTNCYENKVLFSNDIILDIIEEQQAKIVISTGNNPSIEGTLVEITSDSENEGTAPVYEWYLNGNSYGDNTDKIQSNSFSNGDTLFAILKSSINCPENNLDTSNTIILEINKGEVKIPNAITANGDGYNDYLDLSYFDLSAFDSHSVEIYTRGGLLVFSTDDYNKEKWFGQNNNDKKLPTGTYYYIIKFDDKIYTGDITIFR